jgi:predicted ATPase/DNA-binding SARP family transcriptional activator/Flp pilus assembly protein TadD
MAPLPRTTVAFTLWPDVDEEMARNNLRRHLFELRRVLPAAPAGTPWVLTDHTTVCWNRRAPYWLDVEQFEALGRDPAQLDAAAALYAGDLLPDVAEEWLILTREQLRNRLLDTLVRAGRRHRSLGDLPAALGAAARLLRHDPLREDIVREVMALRAECGDWAGALVEYRQFEQRLRSVLNTGPTVETSALYDALARQMFTLSAAATAAPATTVAPPVPAPGSAPPAIAESVLRHNLPAPVTSFFGREREITAIREQLYSGRERVRLLTLTGPGGSGKTRLALEAGMRLAQEEPAPFPQGVFAVMLAALTDAGFILPEIGKALGLHEVPQRSYLDLLSTWLGSRRILLILDNFEHLESGAPLLAELLAGAPGLAILVTSRSALRIYGEAEFPVAPLPVPEADLYDQPEQLHRFAAVNLFLARMRALNPGAKLTHENATAIARLCARLDGLPLALELAAARTKLFSPQALLARLQDQLTFFADARLPERQRTLRSTFDWSHALLNRAEQALFRRLAVFAGGWTLEVMEAICPDTDLLAAEALDHLASLLDKSLVTVRMDGEQVRYGMLETLRVYAAEQLATAGEAELFHTRHRRHFLAVAEHSGALLLKNGSLSAEIERLDGEQDNLRTALEWGLVHAPDEALQLAGALWPYWNLSDQVDEGRRWLEQALAHRSADAAPAATARAYSGLGTMLWRMGQFAAAESEHARSLAAYRQSGDRHGEALALNNLGVQIWLQGERARALTCYEDSLALARTLDDGMTIIYLLTNLGLSWMDNGDLAKAEAYTVEALALAAAQGDRFVYASILHNHGEIAFHRREPALAQQRFQESWALFEQVQNPTGVAVNQIGLATLLVVRGLDRDAVALLQNALSHYFRIGDARYVIECLEWLGLAMFHLNQPAQATLLLGKAAQMRAQINFQGWISLQRAEAEITRAALQRELGSALFAAAWAQGEQTTTDDIVEYVANLPNGIG